MAPADHTYIVRIIFTRLQLLLGILTYDLKHCSMEEQMKYIDTDGSQIRTTGFHLRENRLQGVRTGCLARI
jgi:hypothetical protein